MKSMMKKRAASIVFSCLFVISFCAVASEMESDYSGILDDKKVLISQVKKLLPPDGEENMQFGHDVAISGDTAVVGLRQRLKSDFIGKVYVYQRNQGGDNNWGFVRKFIPADTSGDQFFGKTVDISGNLAIIGSPENDVVGNRSGSAYILDVPPPGTIKGVIKPSAARRAGILWGIRGESTWYKSGESVKLPADKYLVVTKTVPGWKPVKIKETVKADKKVKVKIAFKEK